MMRSIIEIQIENESSMEVLSDNNKDAKLFQAEQIPVNSFGNLMNGFSVNYYYKRYLRIQFCLIYTLITNLAVLHVYFQLKLQNNIWKNYSLIIANIISLFVIILIVIRYLTFQQFKTEENLNRYSNRGGFYLVIIKFICIIAQPYPFFQAITFSLSNTQTTQYYQLNDLLFVFSLFRYGFVLPIFLLNSKYATPRSTRICKLYCCQSNYLYTLKSFFKDFSIQTMIFTFVISSILFAFSYRAVQYNTNQPLKNFQNSLWLAIVTTLTVGYGQLYPKTILGRAVGVLCIYWGVLIISVMIVVLTNTFQLNNKQKKTLILISILEHKKNTKNASAQYIRESLWRVWTNYKNKRYQIYRNQSFIERKLKQELNQLKNLQKSNFANNNIKQEMQFNFNKIAGNIQNLQENNGLIINFLQQKH